MKSTTYNIPSAVITAPMSAVILCKELFAYSSPLLPLDSNMSISPLAGQEPYVEFSGIILIPLACWTLELSLLDPPYCWPQPRSLWHFSHNFHLSVCDTVFPLGIQPRTPDWVNDSTNTCIAPADTIRQTGASAYSL
jgi:hypothetical protein